MKEQRQGGFLIAKIHQVAGRVFARMLAEHDVDEINPAQGRIMFVLWREDGISIRELAKRTALGKSTLTSMLDRLEASGHLRRVRSSSDRRQIMIRRTRKDRALEKLYVRVSQEMTKLFYAGFRAAEIDRFEKDLVRILDNLTAAEAGEG
ncbi:MAG: MarR family winged helix-turn-helix transcriptional regulator [Planctomycetota bacterium]|jgi:DNA-binding MarR family transcriptional regulator